MRKKLNKISVLFLAFIFLLTLSLSSIKVYAENTQSYVYETLEEYLQENYSYWEREEIQHVTIDETIKDCKGLETLTNLTSLTIWNNNLEKIDFNDIPKLKEISIYYTDLKATDFAELSELEKVYISNCTLSGKLDFTKNTNLTSIELDLNGNLSNAIVNIKGMDWLDEFNYSYWDATGFDLKKSILMDDYNDLLYTYSYENEEGRMNGENFFYIYESVEEYLEKYFQYMERDEITRFEC